ncbi:hypothetical protein ABZS66_22700 [Dactylosporangium sp. NPDC005572]|uniref:hypothetical protein n=1 Tax=Dactylosporangium sp. NPDC005572 TaxID=3156889 RepID=UPI00339E8E28
MKEPDAGRHRLPNSDARFTTHQDGHNLVAVTFNRLPTGAGWEPAATAEWAFHTFNAGLVALEAGRGPVDGETVFLAACTYRLPGHRSLSVGDVVRVPDSDSHQWLVRTPIG